MSRLVIAIDGPAGSGKSTVAKRVARELGLSYLDTGAMYRAIALKAARSGFGPDDGDAAGEIAQRTEIRFGPGDPQKVYLDGEEVTTLIRTSEIGELASALSAYSPVRRALVARQQELIAQGGVTLEGRDTTTVVAPHADLKVYMTASVDERARRRTEELRQKGATAHLAEIRAAIEERDYRDSTRADSPLRIADGAVVIDTDALSVDEVVAIVLGHVREAGPAG